MEGSSGNNYGALSHMYIVSLISHVKSSEPQRHSITLNPPHTLSTQPQSQPNSSIPLKYQPVIKMVCQGPVPLVGWQQLLEDELRATNDCPRTLPVYGQVLPTYNEATKRSRPVFIDEKGACLQETGIASSKMEKFKAFWRGEAPPFPIGGSSPKAKSSDASSTTSSTQRPWYKHPILTGEHLPMYRLEESVDPSVRRR